MKKLLRSGYKILLLLLCSGVASAHISLPRLISDGMVLQRDIPLHLWGQADPDEKVQLNFNGHLYHATAGKDGAWQLRLPPQKAGGPFRMTFSGNNTIMVKDILFGDVWIAAGQSNMELSMERLQEKYPAAIASATNTYIRQFEVPDRYDFHQPLQDLQGGHWAAADPANVLQFSAVGYFFALELYNRYKIPVGLINTALGGSPAQAWLSEAALKHFPEYYQEALRYRDSTLINHTESTDASRSRKWYALADSLDAGIKEHWEAVTTAAGWETAAVPGYWTGTSLKDTFGIVWFRKEIHIPAGFAAKATRLLLGRINDADQVYVNGRLAGSTGYRYPQRRYLLPAGMLQEGRNVITIRVVNTSGQGGFVPGKPYLLTDGTDTIPLTGSWSARRSAVMAQAPSQTFIRWKPMGLYNGMIAPLTRYGIKGVIWYQGESNTGNPGEYRALMEHLISGWRSKWGQGNFPFLFVQLANFMDTTATPVESSWAALRQAQLSALEMPNTGMAVAIDLGEWNDIHPLNKQEVGHRLALQARRVAYGEKITACGPLVKAAWKEGDKVILAFDHTGKGLIAKDDKPLRYFAIAGADKQFHWVKAQIRGNTVALDSDGIAAPFMVRYAWADNPEAVVLYNRDGLPAAPFEIKVAERSVSGKRK